MLGMAIVDRNGHLFSANDGFAEITGYPREELASGELPWRRLTPDAAPDTIDGVERGGARRIEIVRRDGSRASVELRLTPLDDGSERRALALVCPPSSERVAERVAGLERQVVDLELYKSLVDSYPAPIFIKSYEGDRPGRYVIANPVTAACIGRGPIVGRTDFEVLPREVAEKLVQHDRMVIESGQPVVVEEQTPDARTGKVIDVISVKIPLFDDAGKPVGIAGLTAEITKQKEVTRRLAALLAALPDVIIQLDARGVCLDFKDNREHELPVSGEDVIGKSLRDTALPGDVQRLLLDAVDVALDSDAIQELEFQADTPSGERYYEARVVKSGTGEVVAVIRDITEARRARDALESLNLELKLANHELRQFAFAASHDLQEPLRTVHSFADLLAEKYGDALDERGHKWIDRIATGTRRMRALIDDLLTYSQTGRASRVGSVDIAALVRDILDDFRGTIDATGAEVQVGELPTLVGNRTELQQVFQNLIGNALKFRRSGVPPVVSIRAEPSGAGWTFSVRDNGIGIDPRYHAHIFQVFKRLHRESEYPGTGIGLALVKKIVESQGGRVSVESVPGQGTEMQFTVPSRLART